RLRRADLRVESRTILLLPALFFGDAPLLLLLRDGRRCRCRVLVVAAPAAPALRACLLAGGKGDDDDERAGARVGWERHGASDDRDERRPVAGECPRKAPSMPDAPSGAGRDAREACRARMIVIS